MSENNAASINPGSFRDPAGFVFEADGVLLRQINTGFDADYRQLLESGLYQALIDRDLLVQHTEVELHQAASERACAVIKPERLPFVSYPYEWSFHQLQAAAIATLEINELAFQHGMVLKDASAYNILFHGAKPLFIDTLSFTGYNKGEPWVGYRQFCQHFLAPLALMSYVEPTLNLLMQSSIDGIPLSMARALLPKRAFLRPALFAHIFLHAKSIERYANSAIDGSASGRKAPSSKTGSISEMGFRGLLDSLKSAVRGLPWSDPETEWGDYYSATNYNDEAMQAKTKCVAGYLQSLNLSKESSRVFDLGANTGEFSQIAAEQGFYTIAADIDPVAVDRNFRRQQDRQSRNLLPLRIDLSAPSPAIGWNNTERPAFFQRMNDETVMALALIHHLAIGNNTPLPQVAEMFAGIAQHLIVEFVPKSDSQVKRLLATREDIFPDYTGEGFEAAFSSYFKILQKTRISSSTRDLYLLRRHSLSPS